MFYQKIIRPVLFMLPPEAAHQLVAGLGNFVGGLPIVGRLVRRRFFIDDQRLQVSFKGINFPNPIGLSAGFDKDGCYLRLTEIMGFGFMEIGSVTSLPYRGNPKPRLRRLPKNNSIVVNYGLKGKGAEAVHSNLNNKKFKIPLGISVAKSNLPGIIGQKAVDDYLKVFERFRDVGDYYTINISCPNTYDGMPFTNPEKLERLLSKLAESRDRNSITRPIFVKINPDLELSEIDQIIFLVQKYKMDGMVIGNLFKDKQNTYKILKHPEEYDSQWPGSLSGKPLKSIATGRIRYVYRKTNGSMFIIGCGGVFSGDDAYEKIRAGALLVQIITGFIYYGPATIRNINRRLLELLERDGFSSIKEAVGKDVL